MTATEKKLAPGIYFDNSYGWHNSARVINLAVESGWSPESEEYTDALRVFSKAGQDVFEDYCEAVDVELLIHMEQDAQRYIDDNLIPEGCWCGYSEGFGDWGVWENEEAENND